MTLAFALVLAASAVALAFRPWAVLVDGSALRAPWLAALVLVPLLWAAQFLLPPEFPAALSGACLLVLMFGWPLAILTLCAVALAGAWLGGGDFARALDLAAWSGAVPATAALAIGMATRRWLPKHLFVYILARAFTGYCALQCLGAGVGNWASSWRGQQRVATSSTCRCGCTRMWRDRRRTTLAAAGEVAAMHNLHVQAWTEQWRWRGSTPLRRTSGPFLCRRVMSRTPQGQTGSAWDAQAGFQHILESV